MFGLFPRLFGPKVRSASHRRRLLVETLEDRTCPSLTSITFDTPVLLPNNQMSLSGHVSGSDLSGCTVSFTGAVGLSTTTDASGNFSVITATSIGMVYVSASKDMDMPVSTSRIVTVPAPTLTLSIEYLSWNSAILSGTVTSPDAAGAWVDLIGSGSGGATCDASGYFSKTISVNGYGTISAFTSDSWAQMSNYVQISVTPPSPPAPTLTLSAQAGSQNSVVLSGDVSGAGAAWASITFSGAVSGSTTADANGHYTYTTSSAMLGAVSAMATTWMPMQSSQTVTTTISVVAPTISLGVSEVCADQFVLSGHVTGANASGAMIYISGAKSGSMPADASGNFSFTLPFSQLGVVQVYTTDSWAQTSNTAQVTAANFPPVIHNFQAISLGNNQWTLQGVLLYTDLSDFLIEFGGLAPLGTQFTAVEPDGSFHLNVTLTPDDYGLATARAFRTGIASDLFCVEVS